MLFCLADWWKLYSIFDKPRERRFCVLRKFLNVPPKSGKSYYPSSSNKKKRKSDFCKELWQSAKEKKKSKTSSCEQQNKKKRKKLNILCITLLKIKTLWKRKNQWLKKQIILFLPFKYWG